METLIGFHYFSLLFIVHYSLAFDQRKDEGPNS